MQDSEPHFQTYFDWTNYILGSQEGASPKSTPLKPAVTSSAVTSITSMQLEELAVEVKDFAAANKSTLLSPFYADQWERRSLTPTTAI